MSIYNDGLPEPIFRAVQNDKYDKGDSDYTPSSLNQPAYQLRLLRDHSDKVREPASGKIWSLLGTSVHHIIERAGEDSFDRKWNQFTKDLKKAFVGIDEETFEPKFEMKLGGLFRKYWRDLKSRVGIRPKYECERRFYGEVEVMGKTYKIGSQVDILDRTTPALGIYDMKVTTAYSYGKDAKADWVQQLNVGRWCVWKETGEAVESLTIVAIWRDWLMRNASRDDYPSSQVTAIEIPVWDFDVTEAWIRNRVAERVKALELPVGQVAPCTRDEMWAGPDKFAVKKAGSSRARRVFGTYAEATAEARAEEIVEVRAGERKRCQNYCPVAGLCPSYSEHLKKFG